MIPFKQTSLSETVSSDVMERAYENLRTPVKCGPVMKFDNAWTDSPSVFRSGDMFYMYFISIAKDTIGRSGMENR
ncbi:MAG: hypothetical protein K6G90_12845 [Clostridia bacterium]|nr:hypothetical protein [Clostridia bacterium]